MKATSPWMRLWPKDLLANVHFARMTLEAKGAYMVLLCYCWLEKKVPSDVESLSKIWGCETNTAEALRKSLAPRFKEDSKGYWQSPRVEKERRAQAKATQKGKAGSKGRWKGKEADA